MMVGTTFSQVQPWRAMSCQNALAEKRIGITTEPPCTSGAIAVTTRPLMWYSGSVASTRSPAPSACSRLTLAPLAARLRWVSSTPLGVPVVPEVYISSAGWCGCGGARGAAPGCSTGSAGKALASGAVTTTGTATPASAIAVRIAASPSGEVKTSRVSECPRM
ncbi:hypothetical protein D9M68_620090 [compost metagenome]